MTPPILGLDLALVRWSVVCREWQDLSTGSQPDLGAFLGGWFCHQVTFELPEAVTFRESFRAGWSEAKVMAGCQQEAMSAPLVSRETEERARALYEAGKIVEAQRLILADIEARQKGEQ